MGWTPDSSAGSGGGGGGAAPLLGFAPAAAAPKSGGPFIDWSSLGSILSSPVRATAAAGEAAGGLVESAGRGLLSLPVSAAKEGWTQLRQGADVGHSPLIGGLTGKPIVSPQLAGAQSIPQGLEASAQEHPLTTPFLQGAISTGQDIEQTARAGVNRLLPGTPAGAGVGQLGSGPGLLGETDLAKAAARGGGGVAPRLLNDAVNLTALAGPVEGLLSDASKEAAATAASHGEAVSAAEDASKAAQKAASQAVQQAAKQAREALDAANEARQAAASGDPGAAAEYAARNAAAGEAQRALQQAQAAQAQAGTEHGANVSLAQQAQDGAQAHADQLDRRAQAFSRVAKLGSKVAGSPFAPIEYGVPLLGKLAHLAAEDPALGPYVQRIIDRVDSAKTTLETRRQVANLRESGEIDKLNARAQADRGMDATVGEVPTEEKPVGRGPLGLFGTKTKTVVDHDAQAVAIMGQTGEAAHLRNLLGHVGELKPGGTPFTQEDALGIFDATTKTPYTPEQLDLAARVHGPGPAADERVQAIRDAIPRVKAAYGKEGGAEQLQANRYLNMEGEAGVNDVRPEPGAGARAQAEHNVFGQTSNTEHLDQVQDMLRRYEKAKAKGGRALEKAGVALTKAAERLDATGLTAAERANPRALFERLYQAPTEAARAVVAYGPHVWEALATAPEQGLASLARKVVDGKLAPDLAIQGLADQILKLARKDPDTLSPPALTVVEEAKQRGMGDVTPRISNVSGATAPAVRLGVGAEKVRAGNAQIDQAATDIVKGQTLYGKAMDRLGAPTRDRAGRVAGAARRVARDALKLGDLRNRAVAAAEHVGTAEEANLFEHAGVDRKEVISTIRDLRQGIKDDFKAQAQDLVDELSRQDVPAMRWPPETEVRRVNVREGEQKGNMVRRRVAKADALGIDNAQIAESGMAHDNRFFRPDGATPEQIEESMRHSAGEGGQETAHAPGELFQSWFDTVQKIRDLETFARVSKEKGWDPISHPEAIGEVRAALTHTFGPELAREMAEHVASGPIRDAADAVGQRLTDVVREDHRTATTEARATAVQRALENDRATEEAASGKRTTAGRQSLDTIGKAQYDLQVAADRERLGGQVLGQREARVGREASAGAASARTQGRSEGALIGQARATDELGDRAAAQGERTAETGARITGQAPELAQETAKRVAGPVGQMYREAGKREQTLADATARYAKEQRALDRLDEGLAAQQREFENSVEAAPRPMRPVLKLGEEIRDHVTPLADLADKEYGPGAGDVWRNIAAEATLLSADTMSKYGIDPQFLIGSREGSGLGALNDVRSGGPVVGATGTRKPGIGLKHATDYDTLRRQIDRRIDQAVDNITGQKIISGQGGHLGDLLRERGVPNPENLNPGELAQAMRDTKLSAWNLSDRRGGLLPEHELTVDTPVVPTVVWKEWARYHETPRIEGAAGKALFLYDKGTQFLKQLNRLSPRWQVSITTGHAIMAMVGIGADPITYFGHDVPAALRLDKMARTGEITAEDAAWIKTLPPQVQAALDKNGGFVPGAIRDRGFVRQQFPTSEAKRALLGGRGQALQSSLDNMHRTATWIHQLERGLDEKGLADFRTAYPDMAHLSNTEIQNEAAIRLSIRTMGDYLNRTPAERAVISRIVYFYPWLKHITKLAMNTAVHDPLRTAWILHLGAMFDPGPGPLNFLTNSYDAGKNRWITPPTWNPFDAIVSPAQNPLGSVNPIPETVVAGLTGFNLGTLKPVTRPAGEKGGLSAGETANFALNESPLIAAGRQSIPALVGSKPVVRYQTGQPIITGGRAIPANENQYPGTNTSLPDWLAPLAPQLGLPQQRLINADAISRAQLAAQARDAKARANYQKRRKAAAGK